MATTYIAIATVEVGAGGIANIEFTNIPQTYTDLVMLFSVRSNNSSAGSGLYESLVTRINGSSTAANYYSKIIRGDGTGGIAVGNYQGNVGWIIPGTYVNAANVTANTFSNFQFYLPNYAGSASKSLVSDGSAQANSASLVGANSMGAGKYSPTTAITSISIAPEYGSAWVQYSTATLYGIKNS